MQITITTDYGASTVDTLEPVLFALALRRAALALERVSRAEDGDDHEAAIDASRGASDLRDLADAIDDAYIP